MAKQGAFTAIVPIRPDAIDSLRAILKEIGDRVDTPDCRIAFQNLTSTHFMRWVILDAATDVRGVQHAANLVISTNYDLPLKPHLREVVAVGGVVIEQIYGMCEGYRPGDDLVGFLMRHRVPYAAFYVGTPGRSVARIRQESGLHAEIQNILDRLLVEGQTYTAVELRDAIRQRVTADPALQWVRTPPSWLRGHLEQFGSLYGLGLTLLLLILVPILFSATWWIMPLALLGVLIAAIIVVLILAWLVDRAERSDAVDPIASQVRHVGVLVQREDQVVQNQLSHLVDIKRDWFRPWALRVILFVINALARYVYVNGRLGSIPTIHFARWVILDRRRLLFFSNYDGSWENYLGDFIDKAAPGLTAIWSNTVGCPKAERLVGAGARDEQRFKSWTRDHQIFTQVWYSAYEDLTVENINNNSKIREGLHGRYSEARAVAWLARL